MNGSVPADDRTPAQVIADNHLQEAVEEHNAAYAPEDSDMANSVVTEFVVVYAARGFAEDGSDVFRTVVHPSRSATPHGATGLLQTALWDAQAGHYGWNDEEDR